jgi:hypothetical protein
MSKYPKKTRDRAVQEVEREPLACVEPPNNARAFLRFTYSSQEMSSFGGKTYVKSKETRFEDGRLKSEEFEGMLDGSVYERMVTEAQRYFLSQTASLLKQFSVFLPRLKR